MDSRITLVPHSLKASTENKLTKVMWENNAKDLTQYTYFDISFNGKYWVAWFYREINIKVEGDIKTNKAETLG